MEDGGWRMARLGGKKGMDVQLGIGSIGRRPMAPVRLVGS